MGCLQRYVLHCGKGFVVSKRPFERIGGELKHMLFKSNSLLSAYEVDDIIIHGSDKKTENFNLSISPQEQVPSATNFRFFLL
jgi:hypothetical protein